MPKFLLLFLPLVFLIGACKDPGYVISDQAYTVLDATTNRRYLDLPQIASIPAGPATLTVKTDGAFYIKADEELLAWHYPQRKRHLPLVNC